MARSVPRPDTRRVPWSSRLDKLQRRTAPYLFISPFFILFAIFGLFPIIFSMYLSLQIWNPIQGLGTMRYVGLDNYVWLMDDPWFWRSITNTLWIAFASGIPQHLVAIPLAFALSRGISRLRHPLTAAYFLPYITSAVAISLVFQTIFGTQFGILNHALIYLANAPWSAWLFGGLADSLPVNWLGRAPNIKPAIAILVWWQFFGWNVVLYAAGLATIPKDYYEAAEIDGASVRQSFFHITLPLLRPMIFFAVTLTIIGNLQLFDQPFILTGGTGGTGQAGMTVAMYLYRTGFVWLEMGTAAAISWLLFLLIGTLTLLHFYFFGRAGLETRD
jgi:multiple sugar transport system permease protein